MQRASLDRTWQHDHQHRPQDDVVHAEPPLGSWQTGRSRQSLCWNQNVLLLLVEDTVRGPSRAAQHPTPPPVVPAPHEVPVQVPRAPL